MAQPQQFRYGGIRNKALVTRKIKLRDKLVGKQAGLCHYCGKPFSEELKATLDHKVAQKYEDHVDLTEDGCVAACFPCNQERGTTRYETFLNYKKKVRD